MCQSSGHWDGEQIDMLMREQSHENLPCDNSIVLTPPSAGVYMKKKTEFLVGFCNATEVLCVLGKYLPLSYTLPAQKTILLCSATKILGFT